ncbi:MAG: hypothetical protein WC783_03360 [Candidatus Paceibacterota bacterium]|jgi:hypothetical protein
MIKLNDKHDVDYTNPYGIWRVTTEGDCEGKSTRDLGTYEGRLDEIAYGLRDKQYYKLRFEKLKDMTPAQMSTFIIDFNEEAEVMVSFSSDSKTWDLNPEQLKALFERILNFNTVTVKAGGCYAGVTLHFKGVERFNITIHNKIYKLTKNQFKKVNDFIKELKIEG